MTTNRSEINKELEEIGSSLSRSHRSDQLNVPDGYFDKLEKSILNETINKNSAKIIHWPYKKLMSIAASMILISFAWWWMTNSVNELNNIINIDSPELVVEYLLDNGLPEMAYLEDSEITISDIYAFDELTQEDLTAYFISNIEEFEPSLIDDLIE
jgi:hypothetical protein